MSKAQTIRKKALDLVRQQDWGGAIKEYRRLVEIDQNNPNNHNELADLYVRTGQKPEAYDAFVQAIDEYTRVGLHNNAVAVAKKVLRVLPARSEIYVKLGSIRMRQGLAKEAESYYLAFLEKAVGGGLEPAAVSAQIAPVIADMAGVVPVLQKAAQCLLAYRLNDEAVDVLVKLYVVLEKSGDAASCESIRATVEKLGAADKLDAERTSGRRADERTVVTEQNIWTESHSDGERIDIESTPRFTPPATPAEPAPQPAGSVTGGPSERDQYLLRLARGVGSVMPAENRARAAEETAAAAPATGTGTIEDAPPVAEPVATPAPAPGNGSAMHISAILGDDDTGGDAEADYRSHYDLGMAYLEMDLLSEAIREYQSASRSPQYQVKCLEMIGLCFIRQNQPQLAIRQLSKGLSLIGNDTDDALGIKYNLGLAYEMIGDAAAALTQFEDVYVVDVTFRDVSDKVRSLGGAS